MCGVDDKLTSFRQTQLYIGCDRRQSGALSREPPFWLTNTMSDRTLSDDVDICSFTGIVLEQTAMSHY
jgi:hypothetical protein